MSGETVVVSSRGSPSTCSSVNRWNELEERLGHRVLDEEARPGEAHLAGVVVLARRLPRSRLEVGVGEDE